MAALGQTEEDNDEEPQWNIYSDSGDNNDKEESAETESSSSNEGDSGMVGL